MNELINKVNWDKVKGFCFGVGAVIFYFAVTNLYIRLANAEAMIMLLYRALSGQAS